MSKPRKNKGVKSYVGIPVSEISKYYGPNAIVNVSRVQLEALGQTIQEVAPSVVSEPSPRLVVPKTESPSPEPTPPVEFKIIDL